MRSNGGCSGGDNVTVAAYQPGAARRLTDLSRRLRDGAHRPGPYRAVDVPKRSGGHRRLLIPCIEDRIIHTAIAQVLNPVLEPQFEESSFAYRPGRSVKQAVQAIERWRNAGFWHVIEADIVGFFDAIRHDLMLQKLEAALDGHRGVPEVVDFVASALEHQSLFSGIQGRGVAQGSPMSPLLSNLYLDALDEALDGKGVRLVRFADDFVVLCKRRCDVDRALTEATEALSAHGLDLHKGKTRVVDFDRGFEFLGHLFVRNFVLQRVSDPDEDPVQLMRLIAGEDKVAEDAAAQKEIEAEAGYDRGDRVLYLTQPGLALVLRNLSFAVMGEGGREMAAIAHSRVDRIEAGPAIAVGPEILDHCLATDTDFAFIDGYGSLRGMLVKPELGHADLQLAQAEAALDPANRVEIARLLVDARIRNQRTQLFRLNRRQDVHEVTEALTRMGRHLRKLSHMKDVDQLRGLEGAVAAEYWPALGHLTEGAAQPFRRLRPATDPLNATINYLTAVLLRDMRAAVLTAGLHPGFGTLHVSRDRADAAVYDLMEPFRAPLTEGLAAYLFNARRLRSDMFSILSEGGVRIEREARTAIIKGYEQAVAKRVNVTGRKYKLAWRPMMRRQAQDLARALRARNMSEFQPYLMEA